jgi:hypothetical protein
MATDDNDVATKGDVRTMGAELRGEMQAMGGELRGEMQAMEQRIGTQLRGEMQAMRAELRGEMQAMERRLVDELVGVIKSNNEDLVRHFNVLDDKYGHLPGRVTTVERELDEHRRDGAVHRRSRKN